VHAVEQLDEQQIGRGCARTPLETFDQIDAVELR